MSKLIIFSIPLFFSLTFSRTLLIPEEFTTIQQAVVVAQNCDTVSVNFGHPNGQRSVVSYQRIMGKAITFEIRGEGKEKLFDILKGINVQLNTDNTNWLDSGWTEQQLVNRLDTLSDQQPSIAFDNSGRLWAVWIGLYIDSLSYDMCYSKWNGTIWDDEKGIIPYTPGQPPYHLRPRITFDNQDRAWVLYAWKFNDTEIIYFTRWNGTGWEPEAPVHQIDSIKLNFAPRIAFGGGEIWCCWYGGISDISPYDIYVSRWNGDSWEPKMKISPPVGSNEYIHWFCDIAVDRYGHPHVVWGETWFTGRIYYRTYNGSQWLPPEIVNNPDPDTIWCAGWPAPAIAIDNEDNIHVVWIGFRPDGIPGLSQEVYYSKFDRTTNRWLSPVQINNFDDYNDRYPDITIETPNDIWVGWSKEISFWESYLYVSHFDGIIWSNEERLDNRNITYFNSGINFARVDADIFAVWCGFTVGIDHTDIYYSRYLNSPLPETQSQKLSVTAHVISPNPFANEMLLTYKKDTEGSTSIAIYDLKGNLIRTLVNQKEEAGRYNISWNGKNISNKEAPDGVYFVLFKSEVKEVVKKIIKIGRIK